MKNPPHSMPYFGLFSALKLIKTRKNSIILRIFQNIISLPDLFLKKSNEKKLYINSFLNRVASYTYQVSIVWPKVDLPLALGTQKQGFCKVGKHALKCSLSCDLKRKWLVDILSFAFFASLISMGCFHQGEIKRRVSRKWPVLLTFSTAFMLIR